MSRIDDLVKELCPNGVKFETVETVFNLKNGYTPSTSNPNYWEGKIPWIRMEDIRNNGRILSDSEKHISTIAIKGSLFPKNSLIVSTSATIGEHALIEKEFLSNQRFTCLAIKKDFKRLLLPKFIFYWGFLLGSWCRSNTRVSNFASVDMDGFRKFKIPIPPLSVQEEIVKILDKYTALEAELQAELEAELEAREKQYVYYRDKLLDFSEATKLFPTIGTLKKEDIKHVELGKIASICDGVHKTPNYKEAGIPFVSVENIDNLSATQKFITPEDYKKDYKLKPSKGDLLMTRIGLIGKCAIVEDDSPLAYYVTLTLIKPNKAKANSSYLRHWIESSHGKKELHKKTLHTAVPIKINLRDIGKLQIVLPPLHVQEKIVSILDKFEKLCHDLTERLPAEIEARRKQYEYYRDKLLTFPKAKNQEA